MKQLYIYLTAALALLLLPGGTDVAKLAPAELVYVQTYGKGVTVRTDLGDYGIGQNLQEAFADLENTTTGKVFLDTAEYLLVNEEGIGQLEELKSWLKEDCRVCLANEIEDLESAAAYLNAHPPSMRLKEWSGIRNQLTVLTETNKRFCIKGQKR